MSPYANYYDSNYDYNDDLQLLTHGGSSAEPQTQRDGTLESWRGEVDIQMMQARVSLTSFQGKR